MYIFSSNSLLSMSLLGDSMLLKPEIQFTLCMMIVHKYCYVKFAAILGTLSFLTPYYCTKMETS